MRTTAQPIISNESSDEDDSELDNEEGYNTSDDVSDDYGSNTQERALGHHMWIWKHGRGLAMNFLADDNVTDLFKKIMCSVSWLFYFFSCIQPVPTRVSCSGA